MEELEPYINTFKKEVYRLTGNKLSALNVDETHISIRGKSYYPNFVFYPNKHGEPDMFCYPYLGKTVHFNSLLEAIKFYCIISLPGNYYSFLVSLFPEPAEKSKYIMPWENIFTYLLK